MNTPANCKLGDYLVLLVDLGATARSPKLRYLEHAQEVAGTLNYTGFRLQE